LEFRVHRAHAGNLSSARQLLPGTSNAEHASSTLPLLIGAERAIFDLQSIGSGQPYPT